jgi:hypothetical protein
MLKNSPNRERSDLPSLLPKRKWQVTAVDSTAGAQASPAKSSLADIPPNYQELHGKNLVILGVAIRNEILKFGFVIEDFQVGILETPIQV